MNQSSNSNYNVRFNSGIVQRYDSVGFDAVYIFVSSLWIKETEAVNDKK